MMSATFPSSRRKRPQPSTSSSNNSFVKTVTEKVSGLIPTRISKWFSGTKSGDINGSAAAADASDSSTDEDDANVTTQQQPPAKRMRFNIPGQHSQFNPVDANWVPNTLEIIEPTSVPHSSIQSPPIRSMYKHETNPMSTSVRSINEESFVENNKQDSNMSRMQRSVSSMRQSVAKKRELIIQSPRKDSKKVTPTTIQSPKLEKPCFKPGLQCSPFYSGRTMYGGASSFHMNQTNTKQKKAALMNKSRGDDTTMSHSTRTIMDLLENYSSPLSEARRIPQYVKNPISNKPITKAEVSSKGINAFKRQELCVPHIATIMQIKQRSRLMDTTSIARQLIASHSSTIGVDPYPKVYNRHTQDEQEVDTLSSLRQYRLKTKLTKKNRDVEKFVEETPPPVNLPNAVLQISPNNLPNFSTTFTLPTTSMALATTTPSANPMSFTTTTFTANSMSFLTSTPLITGESRTTIRFNKANNQSGQDVFQFAKPDPVGCDLSMIGTHPFNSKFGSPERGKENISSLQNSTEEQKSVIVMANVKKDFILTNMLKERKHSDCCVNNKLQVDKCLSCGDKTPTAQIDKSSKHDICNLADAQNDIQNYERINMKKTDATPLKSKDIGTWKCNDCWVNNEESVDKCVCCGSTKPNKLIAGAQNTASTDWTCDICFIWNKDSLEKCIACGTAKITSKNTAEETSTLLGNDSNKHSLLSSLKTTDDDFISITKSQKIDKWECSSCLVKNNMDKTVCICCGTDKLIENRNTIQFNFTDEGAIKFKFGISNNEPVVADMDNLMEEESLPEIPKSLEPTPNTILLDMSNNHFGNRAPFSQGIVDESSGVKFGLPRLALEPSFMTMQLPSQSSILNIEKDKPQEAPKIDFGRPEKNNQNSFFQLYSSKSKNTATSNPMSFMGSSISSHDNNKSKDYPTLPVYSSPAITTTPQSPTQNTFRFCASKLNLSGNPFETSASTAAVTTISFVIPSQSVPTTVTSPMSLFPISATNTSNTVPLFSKKDDVATTTLTLYKKSEPVAKTTESTVTTTPIFNFGSSTQNNAPSATAEKTKFNFVFGRSNATEKSVVFKPATFGTVPDSDTGSNKFNLTTANTLSAGPGLFGNPLSGNGLSSGSTLIAATIPTPKSLESNTDVSANTISGGNGLQTNTTLTGVFGTTGQKENMWSANSNVSKNLFVANTTASTSQKPAPFSFGTSTPFNANSTTTSFGNNTQTQHVFGLPNQTTGTQPAMFSSPTQNQTTAGMFGNATAASNPAPSLANMFGSQNVSATPAFGPHNPSITSFEAPTTLNPAPTSAFNFGAAQPTNVIGFGQQHTQQPGVFGFVGSPTGAAQVQFNIGSGPNTAVRRVRKAVRRNPQR